MQKIYAYIFNLTPKKLAVYLILAPLVLFFAHTITSIVFRTISGTSEADKPSLLIVLSVLFIFLTALVLLSLFWLRSTVFSTEKSDLGLPTKWFNLAFFVFIGYLLFNLCFPLFENIDEEFRYIFYSSGEIISFGGLLIAYPLVCYYTARAIASKKSGKPATFISALPFALILCFGTVLSIPFFHKYFSKKSSTNSEIIIIYGISFGLFVLLLFTGFIAGITGNV